MDKQRRKELVEKYKEIKTYMGVYKITNQVNRKVFISATPNLKNRWLTVKSQLEMGMHVNSELQKDWNEFGQDAFTYEVIEEKEIKEGTDVRWEIKQMEKNWLEKIQPFGERGYNKRQK
ncbi:MAG TPA: GIY-YIG nuclease family protein [Clostridiaceae bacterium]|nr:GIY-YIG nuclease family protein [Clostridiaceae bacterium]